MFVLYDLDSRCWKRWLPAGDECQRRLTEQQIALANPGTILRDVNTFLEFVGPGGIVSESSNASLPAKRLPELNAKVSHPIELTLKRALLRDYPNLAGIFILLRVMELLQMKGNRLVVCPAALEFWRSLNSTEQYFALLEALLFQAQSSVLAAKRTREEVRTLETAAVFLGQLSNRWRDFDRYESVYILGPQGQLPPWSLFLQQQLGLIEIRPRSEKELRNWGGRGWLVGGARLTTWGTAVAWVLLEFLKKNIVDEQESDSERPAPNSGEPLIANGQYTFSLSDPSATGQEDGTKSSQEETEFDEASGESRPEAEFGILQTIFQPHFPEWRTVYVRPKSEIRSGTHIFKVTLDGWRGGGRSLWRRLAVPPGTSLDELAGAILLAFKFDDDHLYDFRYRDHLGKSRVYNHPRTDEGPFTSEITVGEAELAIKDQMRFTFDYGDNWQFMVRLEKIDAEPSRLRGPKVIESAGKAPEQYPQSEW